MASWVKVLHGAGETSIVNLDVYLTDLLSHLQSLSGLGEASGPRGGERDLATDKGEVVNCTGWLSSRASTDRPRADHLLKPRQTYVLVQRLLPSVAPPSTPGLLSPSLSVENVRSGKRRRESVVIVADPLQPVYVPLCAPLPSNFELKVPASARPRQDSNPPPPSLSRQTSMTLQPPPSPGGQAI
jgi:hypothetical protein